MSKHLFEAVNRLVQQHQARQQPSTASGEQQAQHAPPLLGELRNLTDLLEEEENSDAVTSAVKDTFLVSTLVDLWFRPLSPVGRPGSGQQVDGTSGRSSPPGMKSGSASALRGMMPSASGGDTATSNGDEGAVQSQALLCLHVALLRSSAPKCYDYLFQRPAEQVLKVLSSYLSGGAAAGTLLAGFLNLVFLSADADRCRTCLWTAEVPKWIASHLQQVMPSLVDNTSSTVGMVTMLTTTSNLVHLLRLCDSREKVEVHEGLVQLTLDWLPSMVLPSCYSSLSAASPAVRQAAEAATAEVLLLLSSLITHDPSSGKRVFDVLQPTSAVPPISSDTPPATTIPLLAQTLTLASESLKLNVASLSEVAGAAMMFLLGLAACICSQVSVVVEDQEPQEQLTETDLSSVQNLGSQRTVTLDKGALKQLLTSFDDILTSGQMQLYASDTVFELALFLHSLPRHLKVILRDHFHADRVAFSLKVLLNGVTSHGQGMGTQSQSLLLEGMGVSSALLRFCVSRTTNATKTLVTALSHIDVDMLVVCCNLLSFLLTDNPKAVREVIHSGALSLLHDALYDYSAGILEATFGLLRVLSDFPLAISEMPRGKNNVISRTMDVLSQLTEHLMSDGTSAPATQAKLRPVTAGGTQTTAGLNATSHAACIAAIGFLGDLRAKLHDPTLSKRAFHCLMETIDRASGSDLAISAELVMYACTSLSHGLVVPANHRPRSASNSGINVEGLRDPLLSLTLALKKYSYEPLMFPLQELGGGSTSFQDLNPEAEERHQRTSALFVSVVRVIQNYASSGTDAQLRVLQDEELLETLWACYTSARQRLAQVLAIMSPQSGAAGSPAIMSPRASIPLRRVIVTVTLPLCAFLWKTLTTVVEGNPRGAAILLRWQGGAIKKEVTARLSPVVDPTPDYYAAAERHRFLQHELEERRQLFRFVATLLSQQVQSSSSATPLLDTDFAAEAALRMLESKPSTLPSSASIFVKSEALNILFSGPACYNCRRASKHLAAILAFTIQQCEEMDSTHQNEAQNHSTTGSEGTSSQFTNPLIDDAGNTARATHRAVEMEEATMVANKAFKLLMLTARHSVPQLLAMVSESIRVLDGSAPPVIVPTTINNPEILAGDHGPGVRSPPPPACLAAAANEETWRWLPLDPLRDTDDAHDLLVLLLPLVNGMLHHDSTCREVGRSIDAAITHFLPLCAVASGGAASLIPPSLKVMLVWCVMNLLFGTDGGSGRPSSGSSHQPGADGRIEVPGSKEEVARYANGLVSTRCIAESTLAPLLAAATQSAQDFAAKQELRQHRGGEDEEVTEESEDAMTWNADLVKDLKEAVYCLSERLLLLSRSTGSPATLSVQYLMTANGSGGDAAASCAGGATGGSFLLQSLFDDVVPDASARSFFLCLLQDEVDFALLSTGRSASSGQYFPTLPPMLKGALERLLAATDQTTHYDRLQAQKYLGEMQQEQQKLGN